MCSIKNAVFFFWFFPMCTQFSINLRFNWCMPVIEMQINPSPPFGLKTSTPGVDHWQLVGKTDLSKSCQRIFYNTCTGYWVYITDGRFIDEWIPPIALCTLVFRPGQIRMWSWHCTSVHTRLLCGSLIYGLKVDRTLSLFWSSKPRQVYWHCPKHIREPLNRMALRTNRSTD